MARRKDQQPVFGPGETVDMTRQEAFERVFRLAREGLRRMTDTERDEMAIGYIESLAVGSHFYKPPVEAR